MRVEVGRLLVDMAPCDLVAREIMALCRMHGLDAYRSGVMVHIAQANYPTTHDSSCACIACTKWHAVDTLRAALGVFEQIAKSAERARRRRGAMAA